MLLHDRDTAQALCATAVSLPCMPFCARSSSKPTFFDRPRSRAHRASRRTPSSRDGLRSSSLPSVKFDTGASVLVSPVPLSSDPTTPTSDLTEVADGSQVPTTGSSMAGSSPLLTAPSFSEALLPQSATEARGAFTVLLGGQLQLLSTASSQQLLDATRAASPVTSTSASSGEYFLPARPLCDFLPSDSPPSSCVTLTTKTASTARHYTSKSQLLADSYPVASYKKCFSTLF